MPINKSAWTIAFWAAIGIAVLGFLAVEIIAVLLLVPAGAIAFGKALQERRENEQQQAHGVRPARRWSVSALVFGAAMVLLGIAGLELASAFRPSAGNLFANQGAVFSPEDYGVVKFLSWATLLSGLVVALGGILGLAGRSPALGQSIRSALAQPGPMGLGATRPAPSGTPVPHGVVFCESCGQGLTLADRFCSSCGTEQPVEQTA